MKEAVKKAIQTGYGLGLLSIDQGKKIASQVKKELELNDAEAQKLARELVGSSKKVSEEVLSSVGRHFERAVMKSGLVTKHEWVVAKGVLKRKLKQKISGLRPQKKKSVFHKIKKTLKKK
jgi:polyhydroxyalkanoate synthesis regulator phasin